MDGLDYAGKHNVKVHAIDTFKVWYGTCSVDLRSMYDQFEENLREYIDGGRVIVYQSRSDNPDLIKSFEDNSVAAVIVDGDQQWSQSRMML
ncbi:MAG: hypothetical protein CM15mV49_330 [uncultured marine virus]|nr:MAG: hypothetical protein CM15mV49_330 [uncultured marine virus]